MHRLEPDWIIRFFGTSDTEDSEGRTFNDIIRFNNINLEYNHDYIQLLFPLPEASPFNPDAPLITSTVRTAFLNGPGLRERMVIALGRMLQFYGFGFNASYTHAELASLKSTPTPPTDDDDHDSSVSGIKFKGPLLGESTNFTRRAAASWLKDRDHNHLRLTRIIRSLRVLGLEVLALALYENLTVGSKRDKVGRQSKMYWKRAATRELWLPPSEDDKDGDGILWLKREILSERAIADGNDEVKVEAPDSANGFVEKEKPTDGQNSGAMKQETVVKKEEVDEKTT